MKIINRNKEEAEITNQPPIEPQPNLDQEIIIHVMPSQSSLSGVTYDNESVKQGGGQTSTKKIGLVIFISGGLIIIALLYFGYRYLIAPSLEIPDQPTSPITAVTPQPTQPVTPAPSEDPIIIDIPEDPIIIDIPEDSEVPIIEEDPFINPPEEDPGVSLLTVSFVDRDNDGLSDLAEEFLGADPLNADTDGDGYPDLEEINNDYNPLGEGRLSEDFPAIKYQSTNLSFLYPLDWEIQTIDDNVWLMSSPDGSMIQLSRRENENQLNVFSWYANEFGTSAPIPSNRILQAGLGVGVLSEDGKIVYFTSPDLNYILVISYFATDIDFNHFGALALFLDTLNYQ